MEQPVTFARHFSLLVWLLMHEPESVDQQKAALRALVNAARPGAVHLSLHGDALYANEHAVPVLTGVGDVCAQFAAHGLVLLTSELNASAADLLGVARIIASKGVPGDAGAEADARRSAAGISTVHFVSRPDSPQAPPALPDMEFGEVYDDPFAEAMARATPRSVEQIPDPTASRGESGGLFAQFAAPKMPTESHLVLLDRLDSSVDSGAIADLLEGVTMLAERARKEGGRDDVVSETIERVVARESRQEHFEDKRIFMTAIKKLLTPEMLTPLVHQLPRDDEKRESIMAVLSRAGEDGAEALIEQLADPKQQRDRRVYFEALTQLKAGKGALLHMLSDTRWFAVRNAAELIGDLRIAEAEGPLNELLTHEDERIRRAANGALMRLGTPAAMQALQHALAGSVPAMRMEAAAALVARRDSQASVLLLKALDAERDPQVQESFLMSLGRLATPEAVERIQRIAEPERSIFRRKSGELRIAAVQALSEARTPEALSALRVLQGDKEQAVRQAATLALSRVARRTVALQRATEDPDANAS